MTASMDATAGSIPAPLPDHLFVFAHGKESGPWGLKIRQLAEVAKGCGFQVLSPDYRHTMDPDQRVRELLALAPKARRTLVLAGSSMGGYVSAMAVGELRPDALFLIAPALYFPGWDAEPPTPPRLTTIVHGWGDDIVPPDRAIRYARSHALRLTLLDSGHSMNERVPEMAVELRALLEDAKRHAAYRMARYTVDFEPTPLDLAIGHADADADARLHREAGVTSHWALVTACNPRGEAGDAAANAKRIAKLRQRVDAAGVRRLPGAGHDPERIWPSEASELLVDPPPGLAEALGREFAQKAIVSGRLGQAPSLVWLG